MIRSSKVRTFILIGALAFTQAGCGLIDTALGGLSSAVGLTDTAIVIAKAAQIRTSYAVVAADLLEVKRGERLDVLDQVEFEKVSWYRVRAHDEAATEGWIEAQHVITSEVLEKSKKLAEEFQGQSPQAAGQLRAASNLRLVPDMAPENVLFKLANGSTFEIMSWRYVPKQEVADVDDSAKGDRKPGRRSRNEEIEAAKEANEPEKLDEKYDIWYQIKLDPSISPAPAGWLFGRQVELQVPNDIVFFQANNRKFVSWQRLDTETGDKVGLNDKIGSPGNWVILSRSNQIKAIDGVEPEFDGILILAFDKYDQGFYTVYRSPGEVWGQLPLRLEGQGDNKTFTVRLRHPEGRVDEKRFVVFRDKNRIKVTPPEDIAQYIQARSR
ncbi:MAG TPA: SH3 domain-containing protein [Pyrinomonadaceae bacterium]|nr:SH3 domain-containing protein [Pyrinomonadaceae bacterium]